MFMARVIVAMVLAAVLVLIANGCAMSGGVLYSAEVYTCPQTLLENVNAKLEALCPTPTPTPPPQAGSMNPQ